MSCSTCSAASSSRSAGVASSPSLSATAATRLPNATGRGRLLREALARGPGFGRRDRRGFRPCPLPDGERAERVACVHPLGRRAAATPSAGSMAGMARWRSRRDRTGQELAVHLHDRDLTSQRDPRRTARFRLRRGDEPALPDADLRRLGLPADRCRPPCAHLLGFRPGDHRGPAGRGRRTCRTTAVAAILGAYEAGHLGRAVTLDELLGGDVTPPRPTSTSPLACATRPATASQPSKETPL